MFERYLPVIKFCAINLFVLVYFCFCAIMIGVYYDDKTLSIFLPQISFLIGIVLPNPRLKHTHQVADPRTLPPV